MSLFGKYTYPNAGKRAHPLVRKAVEQFRMLPEDVRAKQPPLLYWLLGSGTPPYKMSKEDSNYVEISSGNQKCSNCFYAYQRMVNKDTICSQVEDYIRPQGWCKLWSSKLK